MTHPLAEQGGVTMSLAVRWRQPTVESGGSLEIDAGGGDGYLIKQYLGSWHTNTTIYRIAV